MYRKSFAEQHPILLVAAVTFACVLVVAVAFACALVVAHWPIVLVLAALGGTGYLIYAAAAATQRYNRYQAARRQALAARADYEHWLHSLGHPSGVYGRFPPAI
jgi:arginine exporter protein ArgO